MDKYTAAQSAKAFIAKTGARMKSGVEAAGSTEQLVRWTREATDAAVAAISHVLEKPDCDLRDTHLLRAAATIDIALQPLLEGLAGGSVLDGIDGLRGRVNAAVDRKMAIRTAEVEAELAGAYDAPH